MKTLVSSLNGSLLYRMLPFCFFTALWAPVALAKKAAQAKAPVSAPKLVLTPTRLWLESFAFFAQEQDEESLQKLIQATVTDPTDNPEIVNRVFEYLLTSKNRSNLVKYAVSFDRALGCEPDEAREICLRLGTLWQANLDSVLFFETSAGALLKARNTMNAKDCPAALALVREVENKEGDARPVLELLLDVHNCMGDSASAAAVRQKLDEIENIGAHSSLSH